MEEVIPTNPQKRMADVRDDWTIHFQICASKKGAAKVPALWKTRIEREGLSAKQPEVLAKLVKPLSRQIGASNG